MKVITKFDYVSPEMENFEIVERKGLGHPDTLADTIAEQVSVEYSKYCLENFGYVLHHNVDKVCIMGGLSKVDWGYAEILEPVRVLVNGRISASFEGKKIPIEEIIRKSVHKTLSKALPKLNLEKKLVIINKSTQYSRNPNWFYPRFKEDLPEYKSRVTNDTSAVVGFWPKTLAETITLELEALFYNRDESPKYDFIGQDIKIMVIRDKNVFNITMCIPFFAQHISSYKNYEVKKNFIYGILNDYLKERLKGKKFNLFINTQDQNVRDKTTVRKLYFVATGSSTDFGEEGCVGRGNNRTGFIPMKRAYSMEAAWGKNPVYHVGKVYGLIVDEMAKFISEYFDCDTETMVVTRNGDLFFNPYRILVSTSKPVDKRKLREILLSILSKRDWTERLVYQEAIVPKVYLEIE